MEKQKGGGFLRARDRQRIVALSSKRLLTSFTETVYRMTLKREAFSDATAQLTSDAAIRT